MALHILESATPRDGWDHTAPSFSLEVERRGATDFGYFGYIWVGQQARTG